MCKKCMMLTGVVVLVLGVLFLLQDLKVWSFWNISWYTALLIVGGLIHVGASKCPDCEAARMGKGKK